MNEQTAPEWRDCADPDELAAAVAAGVEDDPKGCPSCGLHWADGQIETVCAAPRGGGYHRVCHACGAEWDDSRFGYGVKEAYLRSQPPTSWTWRPEPPAPDDGPLGIYVASRTIHAAMWKELRSEGVPIISTWLDEAGAGETEDFSDLWRRCVDEVKRAGRLVAFHSEGDVWKGAFIEIGVALGAGVPVTVVGGPPGSWPAHPLVSQARSVREAVGLASPGEPPEPPATDNLAARARQHADTHPESRELIERLLTLAETGDLSCLAPPPPVPPWPGAVLSGLCDEDGEPTWLAQAGDVRGEQARIWHGDVWNLADVWDHRAWVEVRAPRAVPEPETERVDAWEAVKDGRRVVGASEPFEAHYIWRSGPNRVFIGERTMDRAVALAPDGTVEVLKDGDR